MDLCVWARNNATVHRVGLWTRAKSNESCSWKKHFEADVTSAKLVMWRLFHFSSVGRSILSCTPQFVCLNSSKKYAKRTREDESLFTVTMRALTHRLTSLYSRTFVNRRSVQKQCFGDVSIGVEKVLRQVVLWKTIKSFFKINICIFIIWPGKYRATLVCESLTDLAS